VRQFLVFSSASNTVSITCFLSAFQTILIFGPVLHSLKINDKQHLFKTNFGLQQWFKQYMYRQDIMISIDFSCCLARNLLILR